MTWYFCTSTPNESSQILVGDRVMGFSSGFNLTDSSMEDTIKAWPGSGDRKDSAGLSLYKSQANKDPTEADVEYPRCENAGVRMRMV
jgi:hypothetical protein